MLTITTYLSHFLSNVGVLQCCNGTAEVRLLQTLPMWYLTTGQITERLQTYA